MKHNLERYSAFKTVAWATVILFAIFVGIFTFQVKDNLTEMNKSRNTLEANLELNLEKQHLTQ